MPEYLKTVENVIRSGWFINGPEVKGFESDLAAAIGSDFCVAVSTGLDAIRLILKGYQELGRLKEGDEVIIPANTFIATFLAVTDCGLKAVAADIDENTFCLDFESLPLTERTRAVIPVHLYGNPCYDAAKYEELKKRGILIIEDNAQAIGAKSCNLFTGNMGDAAAISFYPAKNIGAFGDAGAVLTNDEALAEKVRQLANYGAKIKYHHELCGYNCRMDELQAAVLRVKLADLKNEVSRRNKTATLYDKFITNPDVVKPMIFGNDSVQVWHQYVIRHSRRDVLREYLNKKGIGTEIHYPVPCHKQPCYRSNKNLVIYDAPVKAEKLAREVLSLPIANVTEEQAAYVAAAINEYKP